MAKSVPGAKQYSMLILRLALAATFLWFGWHAVRDPASAQMWLAPWVGALPLVGSSTFLSLFGVFELVIGAMLVLGICLRVAGLLAAASLLAIIINLGWGEIALRDIVLLAAGLAVAAETDHVFALVKCK